MAALAAIDALLDIPAYPFWSLAVFALSLWIIHGLAILGDDEVHSRTHSPARANMPAGAVPPPR